LNDPQKLMQLIAAAEGASSRGGAGWGSEADREISLGMRSKIPAHVLAPTRPRE